jgi:GNAT superfamily N-acetyltransferase
MSWQDRYRTKREPERSIRTMTPGDIPAAVTLARSIGWTQQNADWDRILYWAPQGCFVLDEQDRGIIGTVSTTSYGTALGWIGLLVVAADRQEHGYGRQLMRAAMDHLIACDTQRIMLDASEAGKPLYDKMDYHMLYKIERWEGRASTYLGSRARSMRPADVSAVMELDARLFGLQRPHILMRLMDEFPQYAWVDEQRGQFEGYLLGREMMGGIYLGPWMCQDSAAAGRLLRTALEQLQGHTVVLNIPDINGRSLMLAADHNLRRVRYCTRMIYGSASPIEGEPLAEMGIASLATG